MQTSIAIETQRSAANGGTALAKFTGGVPSDEIMTLEKGDKFTIPTPLAVREEPIRGSSRKAQFVFADAVEPSGNKKVVRIYPTFFSKNRQVVDQTTQQVLADRMKATGSAVDEYKTHQDIQSAMEAVAGKEIVVTDKKTGYIVNRYQNDEIQTTSFLTLDFTV